MMRRSIHWLVVASVSSLPAFACGAKEIRLGPALDQSSASGNSTDGAAAYGAIADAAGGRTSGGGVNDARPSPEYPRPDASWSLFDGAIERDDGPSSTGIIVEQPPDAPDIVGSAGCGATQAIGAPRVNNILWVVDKSGGMHDDFTGGTPGPGGKLPSKWDVVKESLERALVGAGAQMKFGLELFPYPATATPIRLDCVSDGNCCEHRRGSAAIHVPIPPDEQDSIPHILSFMRDTSPGGGRPTARALRAAYEYFHAPSPGYYLQGDKSVVLITEGGPNCNLSEAFSCGYQTCTANMENMPGCRREPAQSGELPANCCVPGQVGSQGCLDDDETTSFLKKLNEIGIKTFIVGIPGSEPYAQQLDRYAAEGGTARSSAGEKYFKVQSAEGLTAALAQITSSLAKTCEFSLLEVPSDYSALQVTIDGVLVPRNDPNGWRLDIGIHDPAAKGLVILQGKACELAKSKGAKAVSVDYGCRPRF